MCLLQVRSTLRELRDSFTQLLRGRRAGVPAALLAAAGRAGNAALQVDAAKALLTATAASEASTGGQVDSDAELLTSYKDQAYLCWLLSIVELCRATQCQQNCSWNLQAHASLCGNHPPKIFQRDAFPERYHTACSLFIGTFAGTSRSTADARLPGKSEGSMQEPGTIFIAARAPLSLEYASAGAGRSSADAGLPGEAGGACREGAPVHAGRCHAQHAHAL